jgi:hypothetical protein
VEDFHLRAIEHARHTTKPLRGREQYREKEVGSGRVPRVV